MAVKLPKPSHKFGYTRKEILDIIRPLKIHHKKFWKAFGVNTCMIDEKTGEAIFYPCDVERALAKILKYRKVSVWEWD